MALAPDMSGVCKMGGDLRDHLEPHEDRKHKHVESHDDGSLYHRQASSPVRCTRTSGATPTSAFVGPWTICPSCVMQQSRVITSSKSRRSWPSSSKWRSRPDMFRAYIWLAWMGMELGRFSGPWIVTPCRSTRLPGDRQGAVAPSLRSDVHDDRPGPHVPHHLLGDEERSGPARNQRSRDDEVHVPNQVVDHGLSSLLGLLREFLGVASGVLGGLVLRLCPHEGRPQALHLLLHRRTNVEGLHGGAQAAVRWQWPGGRQPLLPAPPPWPAEWSGRRSSSSGRACPGSRTRSGPPCTRRWWPWRTEHPSSAPARCGGSRPC